MKLKLSIMMFLQYAVWGSWAPALATPLSDIRFSAAEIGGIYGCLWLACIIAPFIGGQIVDRFFPTQQFLGLAHLAGAVLLYLTAIQKDYAPMWRWMFLYSLLYAPTLALTNSICFRNLKDAQADFGRIRMWGTIGWIVIGIFIGFLRRGLVNQQLLGGIDLLMIAAACSALLGVFCFTLPHTPPVRESKNPFAFLEALSLLKDRNFFIFMFVCFVITTELQFYYIPTSKFLENMGAAKDWVPSIMTVAQIAEIFVLLLLLHVSLKKLGVRKTMVIGMLAWPIRYLLFCIPSLPVIVSSLTLHGFGYAFFFVASQIYVNMKAQEDMRASAQAMLTFFTLGIGNYLGTLFTSWIWGFSEGLKTQSGGNSFWCLHSSVSPWLRCSCCSSRTTSELRRRKSRPYRGSMLEVVESSCFSVSGRGQKSCTSPLLFF